MRLHMDERSLLHHFLVGAGDEDTLLLHQSLLRRCASQCQDGSVSVNEDAILHSLRHTLVCLWNNGGRPNHDPLSASALIDQTRILMPLQHQLLEHSENDIEGARKEQLRSFLRPHHASLVLLDKRILQWLKDGLLGNMFNVFIGTWDIDGWSGERLDRTITDVPDAAVLLRFENDLLGHRLNCFVRIWKEQCWSLHDAPCTRADVCHNCVVRLLQQRGAAELLLASGVNESPPGAFPAPPATVGLHYHLLVHAQGHDGAENHYEAYEHAKHKNRDASPEAVLPVGLWPSQLHRHCHSYPEPAATKPLGRCV
mmetsp:Transcript_10800/g.24688  ORF Transcript_10800/g.24688 Transcript_10800/m.24688 type:complete len:312 (-) Transcript_10800:80-1015(-)